MTEAQQQDELNRWMNILEGLIAQVGEWAVARDWSIRRIEKRLDDRELGSHLVPALLIQKETARLILEPIARSAPGSDGVVDLYVLPAYDDIATLYHEADGWHLRHALGGENGDAAPSEVKTSPLTEEAFGTAIEEMVKHAVSAG